jgi:hypothetical protein
MKREKGVRPLFRKKGSDPFFAAALVALLLVGSMPGACAFAQTSAGDEPEQDEFGVVPKEDTDKDLSLPDPVLDRTWPSPRPGSPNARPSKIAPDEDETDPFAGDPAVRPDEPSTHESKDDPVPPRPAFPLTGPDGKLEKHPSSSERADVLEPDPREPAEIDEEENPSPLEKGDKEYGQESDDPGEW